MIDIFKEKKKYDSPDRTYYSILKMYDKKFMMKINMIEEIGQMPEKKLMVK